MGHQFSIEYVELEDPVRYSDGGVLQALQPGTGKRGVQLEPVVVGQLLE